MTLYDNPCPNSRLFSGSLPNVTHIRKATGTMPLQKNTLGYLSLLKSTTPPTHKAITSSIVSPESHEKYHVFRRCPLSKEEKHMHEMPRQKAICLTIFSLYKLKS